MPQTIELPLAKKVRSFVTDDLKINSWSDIEKYFIDLESRDLNSIDDLEKWLADRSELETVLEEDVAWRYIAMTGDTSDEQKKANYNVFVAEIQPKIAPYSDKLNRKLLDSRFLNELGHQGYKIYLRSVKKDVEIFREENVQLLSEILQESQEFGAIVGAMTIDHDGKTLTLQQASNFLKETDRDLRHEVYDKIVGRRLKDREKLDDLFENLYEKRQKVAKNASFENFRDYMFAALGRFDYTPDDCFEMHKSIEEELVPICKQILTNRRSKLGLEILRPWDLEVDTSGKAPLKPFNSGVEMIDKTIDCFTDIDPALGACINELKRLEHIDPDSRIGKAPGGYNYPLYETGIPFIFMNNSCSLRDMVTIIHEGGHAVHSIVTDDLPYIAFKGCPSEVAELASMSMELISMDHWHHYFESEDDLKRAQRTHLESVLMGLPWIAMVDKFQHLVYSEEGGERERRYKIWNQLLEEFGTGVIDYTNYKESLSTSWQRQLHIYEVPFYYIEYGMAQLGAIAMWRNYREDPSGTLGKYLDALRLGYTRGIREIYEAAGIKFDFSRTYVKELCAFVKEELEKFSF